LKIIYYCPCNDQPSGGVKVIYKHVEILAKRGFEAFVLHDEANFVCNWFEHESPIAYVHAPLSVMKRLKRKLMKRLKRKFTSISDEVRALRVLLPSGEYAEISDKDILVIPEVYGPDFERIGPGIPKIIFNQNAFYTFDKYPMDCESTTGNYISESIKACLVVSDNNQELLQTIFPQLSIFKVSPYVNLKIFNYSETKRNVLSYMPRKNSKHAKHIINALRFKGLLKNLEVVAIDNMSEEDVAKTLKESLIFLSLGFPEGFSLPPAEAMACGAIAVGYHGQGGAEYFKPEWSYPADIWDTKKIISDIEMITEAWEKNPAMLKGRMRKASDYITKNYGEEKIADELVFSWGSIMSLG
jgi:glycosyltransferase involved in cell wall biosynthesis